MRTEPGSMYAVGTIKEDFLGSVSAPVRSMTTDSHAVLYESRKTLSCSCHTMNGGITSFAPRQLLLEIWQGCVQVKRNIFTSYWVVGHRQHSKVLECPSSSN